MLTEYFQAGEIDEHGRLVLDRPLFARGMQSMKRGKVEIVVREAKNRRSSAANRYYWGVVLRLIADYTGDDVNSIHEFMKLRFLQPREIHLLGEVFHVSPSSASLDSQQFQEFVENVRRFAAVDLQVETPDPDPEWFRHRARERKTARAA